MDKGAGSPTSLSRYSMSGADLRNQLGSSPGHPRCFEGWVALDHRCRARLWCGVPQSGNIVTANVSGDTRVNVSVMCEARSLTMWGL